MTPRARRTIAAAGALCVAAMAVLALSLPAAEDSPFAAMRSRTGAAPPKPPRDIGPADRYAAIASLPLFSPSRRPLPPPLPAKDKAAHAAPAAVPTLPKLTLIAVALTPERREAVLRLPAGASSTVKEGDRIEGWLLAKIMPDRVVFRLGEQEQELTFPKRPAEPALGPLARPVPFKH